MTSQRATRRDFLQGGIGAREAGPASDRAFSAAAQRDPLVVSVSRRVMACDFEIQLPARTADVAMDHLLAALDLVEALEMQLTVYRGDGEVMRINREAATRAVVVEPRLFDLFLLAEQLHRDTNGALDITTGPLSDAWGFSRREGRLPQESVIAETLERVGMQYVALDAGQQTIAFRRDGLSVHLNCIGKGYALDRMAEHLARHSVADFLLHGGKSSVLARGDQPGSNRPGWKIGVRHPVRTEDQIAEFQLIDESLSTSGSGTQFFMRRGRRYGHILDPRTGWPAEGLYSATVVAPTAAEADALSTAFYVMGVDSVKRYCDERPEISTLLVAPAEREGEVQLHSFGF